MSLAKKYNKKALQSTDDVVQTISFNSRDGNFQHIQPEGEPVNTDVFTPAKIFKQKGGVTQKLRCIAVSERERWMYVVQDGAKEKAVYRYGYQTKDSVVKGRDVVNSKSNNQVLLYVFNTGDTVADSLFTFGMTGIAKANAWKAVQKQLTKAVNAWSAEIREAEDAPDFKPEFYTTMAFTLVPETDEDGDLKFVTTSGKNGKSSETVLFTVEDIGWYNDEDLWEELQEYVVNEGKAWVAAWDGDVAPSEEDDDDSSSADDDDNHYDEDDANIPDVEAGGGLPF